MKRKNSVLALLIVSYWLLIVGTAEAQLRQFGKNNVRYNQLDQFYGSYRFDVWHDLDVNDPVQKEYLEMVIANLENTRDWMGGQQVYGHTIEKRIPVFLYKTHTDMESSNLVGGFLPEGVGAFVECGRRREVLKADFSRPLSRAIGVHELAHEFQCDILNPGIINGVINRVMNNLRPPWFWEGGAECIASFYELHTRGDIRRDSQIISSSDRHFVPTWEALNRGQVNPYSGGAMVCEFLEEKFNAGVTFQVQGFKQSNVGLGELVYDLTKGELGNPDVNSEKFNQAITRFWMDKYGDVGDRPRPYESNNNFAGRSVMPWDHSTPMSSPALSPDGKQLAAFTVLKYGISLVRYEIPKKKIYVSKEEREKNGNGAKAFDLNGSGQLANLTPQLPPIPWEYLVVEKFETSEFNGFDAAWSPDGTKIAFFARINRDHALVIVEAEKGKILRKIKFESPLPQLSQAFSPSFSSDGEWIYFSAAENTARDIWKVYVGDSGIVQAQRVTNNRNFTTASSVSPDGTKIVYVDQDNDFQHLFVHYLEKERQEQLTFGKFNDGWPSWSDDSSTIVYASDEVDGIWNIYTLDLATSTVSQRTEFPWSIKAPILARGTLDLVYYVSPDEDTQSSGVYDKIFEAKLKKPIRQYAVRNTGPAGNAVFNPARDLFKFELDENQLLNPTPAPERWACGGGNIDIGMDTYWGMVGQSYVRCSNLLETKEHSARFFTRGDLKFLDYFYANREKRTSWVWGAHHYRMPFHWQFYSIANRKPKQLLLNNTWITESSLDLHTEYPLSKFKRIELYSRLRNRSFNLFGRGIGDINSNMFENNSNFSDQDVQMYGFLRTSAGSNLVFGAAYALDTILDSYSTGFPPYIPYPFHGNAFRVQVEFAPSLSKDFQGYTSVNIDTKTYRHLGSSSTVAFRGKFMANNRANGDFMLLCGSEYGRGCDYGSIAGNQVVYGSAELRFPLPGTYLLGLSVRGFLFDDIFYAKFSGETFPAQKMNIPGLGLHYFIPVIGLPIQNVWRLENGKLKPSFYITMHW